jgi:hypothetical protein
LHRTSTKNYKEIEVNPYALGRVRFSGKIGPTQPSVGARGARRVKKGRWSWVTFLPLCLGLPGIMQLLLL